MPILFVAFIALLLTGKLPKIIFLSLLTGHDCLLFGIEYSQANNLVVEAYSSFPLISMWVNTYCPCFLFSHRGPVDRIFVLRTNTEIASTIV